VDGNSIEKGDRQAKNDYKKQRDVVMKRSENNIGTNKPSNQPTTTFLRRSCSTLPTTLLKETKKNASERENERTKQEKKRTINKRPKMIALRRPPTTVISSEEARNSEKRCEQANANKRAKAARPSDCLGST
jgi:hypothetical protein